MEKIPVILDGDPGHDDAIAWVYAKACGAFDIRAVTSVAGNQTIEKVTLNAQRICALTGIQAPIAEGAHQPLLCAYVSGSNFHGESGLDGPALPKPDRPLDQRTAVELMADVLRESGRPVTIIATGPQTNTAALLRTHPELKHKIAQIAIMGGGIRSGNWTPAAEYNIFEDPEAAQIVFESGLPILMAGLDVTERALVYPEDQKKFAAVDNQVGHIVAGWLEFFFIHHRELGWAGSPLHDPCAVLGLIHPEIFTFKDVHIEIDIDGMFTRGATLIREGKAPNAKVMLDVDREKFVALLVEACRAYDGREVEIDG